MSNSGETNLSKLLNSMRPALIDGEFVFLSFEDADYGDHADLQPLAAIQESEGLTLVVPRSVADSQSLAYDAVFRGITLQIHSSLEAVGLTAAFSSGLAEHGISANVVAGFYHDHIFVQTADSQQAMRVLNEITS